MDKTHYGPKPDYEDSSHYLTTVIDDEDLYELDSNYNLDGSSEISMISLPRKILGSDPLRL